MKKKLFFLIVAICVLVCVFAACGNKNNQPGTESNESAYSVTFMPENGEEAVTISATLLSYNDCPLPTREGYVFGGWRYNSSMSVVFPVTLTKDLTLYAIWVEQTVENYTAVFVTNGGSAVGSVTGQVVTEAPATEKAGFTFDGWYLNEALSTPARFPYAMTADTSFYAKFSLSGVSYDTDEEANTIVFKWPAAEGEVYKWDRGISSSEKHDCLNVGGTASFSVRDPGNFSINIYKQTDVGLTNIYSNTFYCIPTFRVEDAGVELRGDEVLFSLPESKYVCQISLSDVLSNNEVIYSANSNSFSLPASYFLSSKKVNFRYAFEGGSESYYSLRSSSLYIKRLATPKCEYYRDGDFALYWSGVADTQSYTLSFFAGDRTLDVRENVLVRKTESNGYIKYDLSPQSLFPNGDYAEFGVEVIAEGKNEGNQIFLSSEKSPRMLVSYVGTADISLQDDKISWVSLYDASSYTINVTHNKVAEPTDTNRTEPNYMLNSGGEYTISVKPNAKLINSYSISASASYNLLELPFVSTTLVTGGVTFMWENVANATGYSVMIVDHETHEVVSNSKKMQNEVRIASYDQKDFPVGLSEVWVTALGDGDRYQNSPATVIAIHRFRTPDISFEVKDDVLSVSVDLLEHNAHYFIDHTHVKGHDDSETGANSRTIEYELVNDSAEDKVFSMAVYATSAFGGSSATTTSTHYYAEAPIYYIDSDTVSFEVESLCRPENFALATLNSFSWTREAGEGKAEFQVKLDSKSGDGVILPIGSTGLDLADLLAAYDKDVLDVGDHTVYLRRVMTEEDAIPSEYVELRLTKLAAVSGLSVSNNILGWDALSSEGLTGYGVLVSIDPNEVTYSDQFVVTGTNYTLDSDVVANESTELYYRVVSRGRFYDSVQDKYFLDSEPCDFFLVRRLRQVEVTIRGGIMRWEKGEADRFTVYDDSLVLAQIAAGDDTDITYDINDIAVGDHRLTVVAHSNDPALFDAPRSWVQNVRRLSIPVLAKRELEDYLFDVGIVEDYDVNASSYRFYTDEIEGNVSVSKEASRTYRFVPESYGVLAAGLYHLTAQAIGNGVTTITSPMSAEITYYKIATPEPYVNYLTEHSQWDIGDIQDCYVIDEYEGLFQDDTFKRTDRSDDLFLAYDLKPCAKAGNNTFFLKAKSHGNVTSEVGSVVARKLSCPEVVVKQLTLESDVQVTGEWYRYTVNGSDEMLSYTNIFPFEDMNLHVDINDVTFIRKVDDYMASDPTLYPLRKLRAPEPGVDWETDEIVWEAIPYAAEYSYWVEVEDPTEEELTRVNVSRLTNLLRATLSYGAGRDLAVREHVFTIYALCDGCVPSERTAIRVYKLASPEISRDILDFSWEIPVDADRYLVYLNGTLMGTVLGSEIVSGYKYSVNINDLKDGTNTFTVVAKGTERITAYASSITFDRLLPPTLRVEKNTVLWDAVTNANTYEYSLVGAQNIEDTTDLTSVYFSSDKLVVGENLFTVVARADGFIVSREATIAINKLAVPVLTVNKETVSWEAINGAEGYYYTLNGSQKVYLDSTSKTFALSDLNVGANTFTIYAVGNNNVDSEVSSTTIYKLEAPTLTVTKNVVTWAEIAKADKYCYTLNDGALRETAACTVTFLPSELADGDNIVKVYAFDANDNYANSDTVQTIVSKLAKPVVTQTKNNLTWNAVEHAETYVYGLNGTSDTQSTLALSYDKGVFNVGSNTFTIYAQGGNYLESDTVTVTITKLVAPVLTVNKETVSWASITGAEGYRCTLNGTPIYLTATSKTFSLSDLNVGANVFTIYAEGYNNVDSELSTTTIYKMDAPSLTVTKNVVTWAPIAKADRYYYTLNNGAAKFTTECTVTFLPSELADGDNIVRVYAYDTDENYANSNTITTTVSKLAKPSVTQTKNNISWNAVENAVSYVYSLNGTGDTQSTLALSYDKNVFNAGANTFTVYAQGGNYLESDTVVVNITKLATPVLTVNKNTVSWAAITGAEGYYYTLNGGSPVYLTATSKAFALSDLNVGANVFTIYAEGYNNVDSELSTTTIYKMDAPSLTVTKNVVTWAPIAKADRYYYTLNNGTVKYTTECTVTFLASELADGDNTVRVYAFDEDENYANSNTVTATVSKLAKPAITQTKNNISWNAVENAVSYVYSLNGTGDTQTTLALSYDKSVFNVGENTFTIYAQGGNYLESDTVTVTITKLATPVLTVNKNTVSWAAINGAEGYYYTLNGSQKVYLDSTSKTFALSDLNVGANTFTIYAVGNNNVDSELSTTTVYKLDAPTLTVTKNVVTWAPIAKADRYYYTLNSGAAKYTTECTVTFLASELADGDNIVRVYAFDEDENYANSNTVTATVSKLAKPSVTQTKNNISWNAVENAVCYVYSLNGTGDTQTTLALSYDKNVFNVGANTFTIYAQGGNYLESDTVVVNITKLAAPVLTVDKNAVSWASITGAEGYRCTLNGTPIYLTATSKTFSLSDLNVGANVFTIYAEGYNNVDSELSTTTIYKMDAPSLTVTKNVVTWAEIAKADRYYYTLNSGAAKYTTECSVTFLPSELADGDNIVRVYAYDTDENYANSNTITTTVSKLAKPAITQTKNNISWNAVENAVSYVYSLNGTGDTQTTLALSYDKGVFNVGENTFTIYAQGGNYLESDTVTVTITKLATPVLTVNKETVSWAAITGAEGYYYTLNGGAPVYLSAISKTFALSDLNIGANTFTIYAVGYNNVDSELSTTTVYKLDAPTLTVTKNVVTWAPIDKADRYYYTLNSGTLRETTECTVTFLASELADGDNIVRVYAYDTDENYANSNTITTTVSKLAKPSVTQTKNNISWNAVENAVSYVYSLNGTGDTQTTRSLSYDKGVFNVGENTFTIYAQGGNYLESDTVVVNITKLATPVLTVNKNTVSWASITGAEGYYYTLNGGAPVYLSAISKTFALSDLNVGANTFTIYAVGYNNVDSELSTTTVYKLDAPTLTVTKNVVTWAPIDKANKYYYRLNSGTLRETTECSVTFLPSELADGDNIVRVYAYDTDENYANSITVQTIVSKLAKPSLTQTKNNLSWTAVTHAESYVYALNGTGDTQTTRSLSYDKNAFDVGENTFTVYAQGGNYLESDTVTVTITKLAAPVLTVNKETVSWAAITGAEGYYYTLNGGAPVYLTATSKAFSLSDLNVGANTFTIYAVGYNNVDSELSTTTVYKLAAPVLSIAKNVVSWEAIAHADRYYYTLNNGAPQYTTACSVAFSATDLTDGTNFVRVYAYDEDDNYADSNTVQSDVSKLAKPVVTIVKNRVVVSPITGASTYKWTLNGVAFDKTEASFTIALADLEVGRNDLTVYAFGADGYSSDVTTAVIHKLQAPVVTVDNDTITCSDVLLDAADGRYCYTLNGGTMRYSASPVICLNDLVAGERNTIVLYAEGGNYADSETVEITIDKLGTPTVSAAKNVVTVDAVANAEAYRYVLNGATPVTFTESPLVLSPSELNAGDNTVTIYAVADGYADSYVVTLTVTKLATPVLTGTKNVVTWSAVTGASGYKYTLRNGAEISVSDTTLDFAATDLLVGENVVTVYAVGSTGVDSAVAECVIHKLATPVLTVTKDTVAWAAISGATKYYYTLNGGAATALTATAKTFALSDLTVGTNTFTLYAVGGNNVDSAVATTTLTLLATPVLTADKEHLSWDPITGADGYYCTLNDGSEVYLTATTKTFALSDLTVGTNSFTLYAAGGNNVDSAIATTTIHKLAAPVLTVTKNAVSWTAVSGATKYYYTLNGGAEECLTSTSIAFTASELSVGANEVTLYAYGDDSVRSELVTCTVNKLAAPAALTLAVDGTRVDWTAVSGADYYVYHIVGAANVTRTSTDPYVILSSSLFKAGDNTFEVYAVGGNNVDSPLSELTVTKLATPVISVDGSSLTFTAVGNASGYFYTVNGGAENYTALTSFSVPSALLTVGANAVSLWAAADGYMDSATCDVTVTVLGAPTVTIDAYATATWSSVAGAEGYRYVLKDGANNNLSADTLLASALTHTFSGDDFAVGVNTLYVYAVADKKVESAAGSVSFVKLAAPVLSASGNVISWTAINGASSYAYELRFGSESLASGTVTSCSYTADLSSYGAGTYTFTLYAKGTGYIDSAADSATILKLDAPALAGTDSGVTWAAVTNAEVYAYTVTIGDEVVAVGTVEAPARTIDMTALPAGTYVVTVRSTAVGYVDSLTDSLTVTKLATPVLTVTSSGVSWSSVGEDVTYYYSISAGSGDPVEGTTDALALDLSSYEAGSYDVAVYATKSGFLTSLTGESTATKLATPSVSADVNALTITAVAGADSYLYSLNDGEYLAVSGLSLTIAPADLNVGDNTVTIYAVAAGKLDSDPCVALTISKLASPALSVTGTGVSWAPVTDAEGYAYTVTLGEDVVLDGTVTAPDHAIDMSALAAGNYTVTLYSVASDYVPSVPSVVTATKLATPSVSSDVNALTITAVAGADSYLYSLNGGEYLAVSGRSLTIAPADLNVGDNTVTIYAVAAGKLDSDPCVALTITKLTAPTLSVSASGVSWTSVGEGVTYHYSISAGSGDPIEGTTDALALDLSDYAAGSYDVTVYATKSGCVDSLAGVTTAPILAAPSLTVTATGVAWASVGENVTYHYSISAGSGDPIEGTTDALALDLSDYAAGSYDVTVYATKSGCVDSLAGVTTAPILAAPSLTVTATGVAWASVGENVTYHYSISAGSGDLIEDTTDDNDPTVALTSYEAGSYTVTVYATAADSITSAEASETIVIAALTLTLTDDVVTWDEVDGATEYRIYENGVYMSTVSEDPLEYAPTADCTVTVRACKDAGFLVAASGSVEYTAAE